MVKPKVLLMVQRMEQPMVLRTALLREMQTGSTKVQRMDLRMVERRGQQKAFPKV